MSKEDKKDLLRFLKPFPEEIQETALWLRDFVWDLYPQTNEMVYDNYNALAFGWSPTDKAGHIFCNVAVGRTSHNVHFGFFGGTELSDPDKILLGQGNQYRYILLKDKKDFPKAYIKKLIKEAFANSLAKVKPVQLTRSGGDKSQLKKGLTITKSVSAVKRSVKRDMTKKKK